MVVARGSAIGGRGIDGLGRFVPLRLLGVGVDVEPLAVLTIPYRLPTLFGELNKSACVSSLQGGITDCLTSGTFGGGGPLGGA